MAPRPAARPPCRARHDGARGPRHRCPFFWTNQGEQKIGYAGYAPDWERIDTKGDVAKLDFISSYIRDGKAVAACAAGSHDGDALIRFLDTLASEGPPDAESLA